MTKPPGDSPPQTAVDAFVAELKSEGTVSEAGVFTLERGRAREKMRKFQLAEPRHYVLPLVQAAVLKGASYIDFTIDSNDLWMRFDGRPFNKGDYDTLYNALLQNAKDEDLRALQELALGANAALALTPRFLRVTSGDAEETLRLELRPDQDDKIDKRPPLAATPEASTPTTEIHVRDKFGLGVIGRAVKDLTGDLPEESALVTRCMFADIPIRVDGKRISEGLAQPATVASGGISGDGFNGLAGLLPQTDDVSWVRWVTHGVLVARHEVQDAPSGCVAIISGDRLRKDVSQGDVVRDEAYEAALAAVSRQWAELLVLQDRLMGRGDRDWARPHLAGAYAERRTLPIYRKSSRDQLGRRLGALPLFVVNTSLPAATAALGKSAPYRDLRCISSAGPAKDVYVAGLRGTVLRLDHKKDTWHSERLPTGGTVRALWAEAPEAVFAFGDKGIPYRRGRNGWTEVPVITAEGVPDEDQPQLNAATGSSARRCFAVGREGRLLQRAGRKWRVVPLPVRANLNGVCAHATSDLFAVGDNGIILRLDGGGKWHQIEPVTSAHLRAISGSSFDDIVAVGDQFTIVQFNGSQWSQVTLPTGKDLYGVWVTEDGEAWAVGAGGTILRRLKDHWRAVECPVQDDLFAVYGDKQHGFYAVGEGGVILHCPRRRKRDLAEWKPEWRPVLGVTMSLAELATRVRRGVVLQLYDSSTEKTLESKSDHSAGSPANVIRVDLEDDTYHALFTELFQLS